MSLLSPYQLDLRTLALDVLYINLGCAAPNFPTTSRAHPSLWVYVDLVPAGGLLSSTHKSYFPNKVRWDIWQKVVVPFFADAAGAVKVHGETQAILHAAPFPDISQLLSAEIDTGGVLSEVRTLRQQVNLDYLYSKDYDSLLLKIEKLLLVGMIEQGYLPGEPPEVVAAAPAPGEPIVPPGTTDGSPYPRFDED